MVSMIVFVLYSTFCFKIDRLEWHWYLVQTGKLIIYIYIYIDIEREREVSPNFGNKIINNIVLHIIIYIFSQFFLRDNGEKIVNSYNNDILSIAVSHRRQLLYNVPKNV